MSAFISMFRRTVCRISRSQSKMPMTVSMSRSEMNTMSIDSYAVKIVKESAKLSAQRRGQVKVTETKDSKEERSGNCRERIERPARPHADLAVLEAVFQPVPADVGNHRAIVGAQGRARIEHLAGQGGIERCAQPGVGRYAAGDDQAIQPGLLQSASALDDQGVDHGLFEAGGDIGMVFLFAACDQLPGVRFQAGKAEIQAGAIDHGSRKIEAPGIALLGQPGDFRTARIGQTEQTGGLV